MTRLFKEITSLIRKFISNPVLLIGAMTLFALLKLLTAPEDDAL